MSLENQQHVRIITVENLKGFREAIEEGTERGMILHSWSIEPSGQYVALFYPANVEQKDSSKRGEVFP